MAARISGERAERPADEGPGLLVAPLVRNFGVDRDEGRRHGALADDLPQHVGDAESDEEGVRPRSGAEGQPR